MMPIFTFRTSNGREHGDLVTYDFLNNRKIYVFDDIDARNAISIISQLEYLDNISHDDITVCIHSRGGGVVHALAIIAAMNRCKSDISTVCLGISLSAGALILSAGKKGKRFISPYGEVMIHQPILPVEGILTTDELQEKSEHSFNCRKKVNALLAKQTGHTLSKINKDTQRDRFFDATEAIEYGFADKLYK